MHRYFLSLSLRAPLMLVSHMLQIETIISTQEAVLIILVFRILMTSSFCHSFASLSLSLSLDVCMRLHFCPLTLALSDTLIDILSFLFLPSSLTDTKWRRMNIFTTCNKTVNGSLL